MRPRLVKARHPMRQRYCTLWTGPEIGMIRSHPSVYTDYIVPVTVRPHAKTDSPTCLEHGQAVFNILQNSASPRLTEAGPLYPPVMTITLAILPFRLLLQIVLETGPHQKYSHLEQISPACHTCCGAMTSRFPSKEGCTMPLAGITGQKCNLN